MTKSTMLYYHERMKVFIDTTPRNFHGYIIHWDGTVYSKTKNKPMKLSKRDRRGGGYDLCVTLSYNKCATKWTLQRLIASCF